MLSSASRLNSKLPFLAGSVLYCCHQSLWGLTPVGWGLWVLVSTQKIFSWQRCLSKCPCTAGPAQTPCGVVSPPPTPCPRAVPALSTLLRDGAQGGVGAEQPVLCRLRANTAHSHPEVQGRPGHLLWPLPRAHQMTLAWQLAVGGL